MSEETKYQTVTIKGSLKEYTCSQIEYPFIRTDILYIKLIVYEKRINNADFGSRIQIIPVSFLIVQPQDILSRVYSWSADQEDDLVENAKIASEQMEEYQKAVEEEMHCKAIENPPTEPILAYSDEEEEEYIDPEFKTSIDPLDSMWG